MPSCSAPMAGLRGFSVAKAASLGILVLFGSVSLSASPVAGQACTFFNSARRPATYESRRMANCSWYAGGSCCTPQEARVIGNAIEPVPGASDRCVDAMNKLVCWPCAPHQAQFFDDGAARLTVCEGFCRELYRSCKHFKKMYDNPTAFCQAKGYNVVKEKDGACFNAAPGGSVVSVATIIVVTVVLIAAATLGT